jgi:hypothetical protein
VWDLLTDLTRFPTRLVGPIRLVEDARNSSALTSGAGVRGGKRRFNQQEEGALEGEMDAHLGTPDMIRPTVMAAIPATGTGPRP